MRAVKSTRAAAMGAGLALAAAAAWGEWVHWRASTTLVGPDRTGSEAVVVLGYRNRGRHRANAVNRWRVRAALRSIDPAAPTQVVFCGGSPTPGAPTEAALMADYAVCERGFDGAVTVEEASRSTWQNVENAVPLISGAARIKIVSNPLHSLKARIYLHRLAPQSARRLVRAADYRFGEEVLLKPLLGAYGLWTLRKANASLGASAGRGALARPGSVDPHDACNGD